jgi:hypothetical protein
MRRSKHERRLERTEIKKLDHIALEKWRSIRAKPWTAEEIIALLPPGQWPLIANLMAYQTIPLTKLAKLCRLPWRPFRQEWVILMRGVAKQIKEDHSDTKRRKHAR